MDMPVVKNILDNYWDWTLPVNIESIAQKLNINVLTLNPFAPEHNGVSGLAEIKDNGKFIYSNSFDSERRKRFTLAHELGHHMLGHVTPSNPMFRDNVNSFSSSSNSWLETQANEFAAEMLMPYVAIDFLRNNQGISNIAKLADIFNVSEAAMYYRLKNLGLTY